MLIPFKKYTTKDLESQLSLKNNDAFKNRRNVRIAVIDDEPFKPLENLLAEGFSISSLGEYCEMRALRDYQIIVCDVDQVGKDKNPNEHGAAVISEIKRVFPEKKVIVYTGLTGNVKKLRLAKERADEYIPKTKSLSIWAQTLDALIEECLNPSMLWSCSVEKLRENNVSSKEIVFIEDKFVRAILKKDKSYLKSARNVVSNEYSKNIISGLIASAIWTVFGIGIAP